jgi:hypothetical protein
MAGVAGWQAHAGLISENGTRAPAVTLQSTFDFAISFIIEPTNPWISSFADPSRNVSDRADQKRFSVLASYKLVSTTTTCRSIV